MCGWSTVVGARTCLAVAVGWSGVGRAGGSIRGSIRSTWTSVRASPLEPETEGGSVGERRVRMWIFGTL